MRARGARHVEVTAGKMRRSLLERSLSPRSQSAANLPSDLIGLPATSILLKPRESIACQDSSATPDASSTITSMCRAWWPLARSMVDVENPSAPQPGRIVAVAGEDLMPGLIVIGKRPAFQNGQF